MTECMVPMKRPPSRSPNIGTGNIVRSTLSPVTTFCFTGPEETARGGRKRSRSLMRSRSTRISAEQGGRGVPVGVPGAPRDVGQLAVPVDFGPHAHELAGGVQRGNPVAQVLVGDPPALRGR